jgi:hypothetical protein
MKAYEGRAFGKPTKKNGSLRKMNNKLKSEYNNRSMITGK